MKQTFIYYLTALTLLVLSSTNMVFFDPPKPNRILATCGGTIGGTGINDDFDGDGVCNSIDLDDDNDGVLDALENPNCYYTASEWNTLAKPSSSIIVTSALTTTTGNFAQMLDGVNNVNAVIFSNSPAQPIQNVNVYLFNFSTAVKLSALYLKFNTATQFAGTTKIQGSNTNNGTDWVDLSASVAQTAGTQTTVDGEVSLTTSIKYPITLNTTTAYKYIRITGVAASNIAAQNASEVYFDFNSSAYNASAFPKESCTSDIDNDGFANQMDLDSDGDGCSDAFEAGATTDMTANYQFTYIDTNSDGLVDVVDAGNDGFTDYASTYTRFAANAGISACRDTDGDGVRDVVDIDDDNDGILDSVECPAAFTNLLGSGGNGGFTTDPPSSNWYYSNSTSNYDTPGSFPFGYGGTQTNSPLTGGLFDELNGNNANTGTKNALMELNGTTDALVSTLNQPLVAGVTYRFSFDAGLRGSSGQAGQNCTLQLYNADANIVQSVLISVPLNSLPSYPGYQTLSGSFTVPSTANYYILFMNAGNGGAANDYIVDRVALVGDPGNSTICDVDGDGIPNYLDLDSDGDGCPDAVEAGVSTNTATSGSMASSGGGIYSGGIPSGTANAYLGNGSPSQYGANGFFNGIETSSESGSYNSGYTYRYAASSIYNVCADTDGDGISDIADIDDDNDGILDALESPDCFYTQAEASAITVTSELTQYLTLAITNSYDGNTNTQSAFATGQDWVGKSVFEITPGTNVAITSVNFVMGSWYFSNTNAASTFKLQGWTEAAWEDLSAPVSNYNSTADFSINNTLHPSTAYSKYRITGVAGTAYYCGVQEISLTLNPYISSAHPKLNCSNDTDGDGIPNHQDLDSDGDGCPDAVEGGANFTIGNLVASSIPGGNSGSSYNGTSTSPVTQNLGNTVGNTATTMGVPTSAGTGQSVSFSQDKLRSECLDTDGDGINDLVDLDDDNDGVVDAVEAPSCYYTAAEMSVPTGITSEIPTTGNIPNLYDNLTTPTFAFTATTAANAKQKTIFEITPAYPVAATSIVLRTNAATTSIFGTLSATTAILKAQGWNGISWVDLATYTTAPTTAANLQTFSFTNSTAYSKYRLYDDGTTGVNITAAALQEVGLGFPATYIASSYPKATCTTDTDGDGIINTLDLDSDGDGCSDAFEAGATTNKTANYQFPDIDSNNDGLVDAVDAGSDGTTDYASTYYYATNAANNACSDYDGDGVPDLVDLDDDNDGILDTVEGCANATASVYVYAYPTLSGGISETAAIYSAGTSTSTPNRAEVDTYFYGQGVGVRKPSGTSYTLIEGAYGEDGVINSVNKFQNSELNFSNSGEASTATSGGYYIIEFLLRIPDNATSIGLRSNTPGTVVCNHALYVGYTGTSSAPTPSVLKSDVWPVGSGNSNNPSPEIVFTNMGGKYVRITLTTNDGNANCGVVLQWSINGAAYTNAPFSAASQDDCNLDTDGDGIPNRLDLDSDGDGCSDAMEGGTNAAGDPITTANLVLSSIPGGNSGTGYTGSAGPVTYNLGNAVDANGIPTIVPGGQILGSSQNSAAQAPDCIPNPTAVADKITNNTPGSPVSFDITTNDTGGDPVNPATVNLIIPGTGTCEDTDSDGDCDKLTVPGEGVWTVTTTGVLTFTPETGFTKDPTPITYTVKGTGGNTSTPVQITVDNVPVATNDTGSGLFGDPVTVSVPTNDTSGDIVDPTTVQIVGTTNPGDPLVITGVGTWSVNATNGAITFTPFTGYTGNPDPISYTVKDNDGNISNVATVTITYTAPTPPTAAPDNIPNTTPGSPVSFNITTNDNTGEPVDPATVNLIVPGTGTCNDTNSDGRCDELTVPGEGVWTVTTTGIITFTPEPGFTKDPTPITYTVDGTDGGTSTPVLITVDNIPIAKNDNGSGTIGSPATVNAINNDTDGDTVDPATIKITGTTNPGDSFFVTGQGTWSVNTATGEITFTPIAGFTGNPTPITYTVEDAEGNISNTATVSMTYAPLPVTLVSFNALETAEGTKLTWKTSTEKNFDRFEIEQSANPKAGFNTLGVVKGGGTNYQFTDAVKRTGISYYRLKMIDLDGSYTYSRIVSVQTQNGIELHKVYPNPSQGFRIYLESNVAIESYKIYDISGREVSAKMTVVDGRVTFQFDKMTPVGIYILTYKAGDSIINQKFVLSY